MLIKFLPYYPANVITTLLFVIMAIFVFSHFFPASRKTLARALNSVTKIQVKIVHFFVIVFVFYFIDFSLTFYFLSFTLDLIFSS